MTSPPQPTAPQPSPPLSPDPGPLPPLTVRPQPESRLDQLTARYDQAKAAEKAAKESVEEIASAIKAELQRLHPGIPEMVLSSPWLVAPLRLEQVTRWDLDTKAMKATHPEVYAAFAKQSSRWVLTRMRG